jgi:hypothetical protein
MARNTSTPSSEMLIALLGGSSFEGVRVSRDELRHLLHFYKISDQVRAQLVAEAKVKHEVYIERIKKENEGLSKFDQHFVPLPFDGDAVWRFIEAGDERNMFREAAHDGLRIMAFLSKYLEPDQDPVKLVIQMAVAADFDVSPEDAAWADEPNCTDDDE